MKYALKHKSFTLFLGVLVAIFTVTTLVMPVATVSADASITCPSDQVPLVSTGQSVAHSCCPKSVTNKNATTCIFAKYLNPLIQLLSAVVGIVVVIGIIVGAIQFSSSAGDPQKAANGKNHIRNALLALLAYLLLYAFLQFLLPGGLFT